MPRLSFFVFLVLRFQELSHAQFQSKSWFHADRAAGGHRDHRHPDRAAPAGRAEGPRGRRPDAVAEQPEAAGARRCRNFESAYEITPPIFGQVRATGVSGSIFYHLLPYMEQSASTTSGRTRPGRNPLKVLQHPADRTLTADGMFDLPVAAPAWAPSRAPPTRTRHGRAQSNTKWGLSSYAANWQVFGDQGAQVSKMQDGLSNTIVFNEKYAVARRPSGQPDVRGDPVGLRG